jgi:RHS repeat-associated protein
VGTIPNGTLSNGTVTGTNLPLSYDGAGNRTNTWGIPYTTNDLNEYTSVGGAPVTSDPNGNIQTRNGWTYTYDAQNRLRSATDGTKSLSFYYDGLNRQITRGVNTGSGWNVTFSVWDGWNLLEERGQGDVLQRIYFYGAKTDELVCAFGGAYNNGWFTQDGRGNVSHVFNDSANLVEHYTYGLSGEPLVWDANNNALSESTIENRFMFQGRDYLKEGAIYDYRNRFYLPSLGRFIQSDPLGFGGGDANLFRFCGGDPVNGSDPSGLLEKEKPGGKPTPPLLNNATSAYTNAIPGYQATGFGVGQAPGVSVTVGTPQAFGPGANAGVPGGIGNASTGISLGSSSQGNLGLKGDGGGGGGAAPAGPQTTSAPTGGSSAPSSFVLPIVSGNRLNESQGSLYDFDWLRKQWQGYGHEHRQDLQSLNQFGDFMNGYALGVSRVMALPVYGAAATDTAAYLAWSAKTGNFQEIVDFGNEFFGVPGETPTPTSIGGALGFGWHKVHGVGFDEQGNWVWWGQ